ncbi:MAG: hypothetical protein ABR980_06680 [Ignavibacteriaceae bacterium]|jgi:hypothetical protein
MVNGLNKFKEFFKNYTANYLLIGGAACDRQIENAGLDFRATKDLDIVLIIEAYSAAFIEKFWEFINQGSYEIQEKSSGEKIYYRFKKPEDESFPFQLELFARNPGIVPDSKSHLTPIAIDEYLTSLSAILLNDDYYNFTIKHSQVIEDLHLASAGALICLKVSAYLDLKTRRDKGEQIDGKDIKKHKNDIIRLAAILADEDIGDLPKQLEKDLKKIIADLTNDPPDIFAIGKNLGAPNLNLNELIEQLEKTFHL